MYLFMNKINLLIFISFDSKLLSPILLIKKSICIGTYTNLSLIIHKRNQTYFQLFTI